MEAALGPCPKCSISTSHPLNQPAFERDVQVVGMCGKFQKRLWPLLHKEQQGTVSWTRGCDYSHLVEKEA